jgi:hypothetical protein
MRQAKVSGTGRTLATFVLQIYEARIAHTPYYGFCIVGRAIINYDQLQVTCGLIQNALYGGLDYVGAVVSWHHGADQRALFHYFLPFVLCTKAGALMLAAFLGCIRIGTAARGSASSKRNKTGNKDTLCLGTMPTPPHLGQDGQLLQSSVKKQFGAMNCSSRVRWASIEPNPADLE